jgi:hypothetical protein
MRNLILEALKLALITVLLCGCTVFSQQAKLMDGLTEPTELSAIPFLKVERMSFLEAGWECARRNGIPPWLHPVFVQIFGCADPIVLHGKVVSCHVIIGAEWILEHELRHCQGYDD